VSAVVLPEFDGGGVQSGHCCPGVSVMMGSFLSVGLTRASTIF
jgi:hypothetical protein